MPSRPNGINSRARTPAGMMMKLTKGVTKTFAATP
jgi:hypothetical protein